MIPDLWKAYAPIFVTVGGIKISESALHSLKQNGGISFILSGILTSFKPVYSNVASPSSFNEGGREIFPSILQEEKALSPIEKRD